MHLPVKVFVLLLFLAMLIIPFISLPKVLAAESSAPASEAFAEQNISLPSQSTASQKALSIMSSVVGLDVAKYNASQTVDSNGSYLGVLPAEIVRYTLNSNGSKLDVMDTFANGSLQMIDVLENNGSPQITQPATSAVGMAKAFLLNYQNYSSHTFYGQLASMLDNVNPDTNLTAISGNLKFNVTESGSSITFTWSYTSSGIDAVYKGVSLEYENGFLQNFVDTWNLYPIGSTAVNLSEAEAESIAMQNAKTYSWKVGSGNETYVVNRFNVTQPIVEQLIFCEAGNASGARSDDPLTLYPAWRIGVGLDKFYPGNVYGIYVDVWADTKQVRGAQEVFSTLPPPEGQVASIADSSTQIGNNQTSNIDASSNSLPETWIIFCVFAVLALSIIPTSLRKKNHSYWFYRLPKYRVFKVTGVILCLLILSAAFVGLLSAVQTAEGSSYAEIWSDSSNGSNGTLFHTQTEINNQANISAIIYSWFNANGYSSYDGFGETYSSTVLPVTQNADQYDQYVATVWFDHGVGTNETIPAPYQSEWHYMLCDENGNENNHNGNIYDYQIYQSTSTEDNYFSYITACMSGALSLYTPNGTLLGSGTYGPNNQGGSGNIIGMPYAWTHELTSTTPNANAYPGNMSRDGFWQPDSGPYCYIGFPWGSAALSQEIDPFSYAGVTYFDFVYDFFWYALEGGESVNQSLNSASHMCFPPEWFAGTALYNRFTAEWPTNHTNTDNQTECTMAVYGNSNIHIANPSIWGPNAPSVSGPSAGTINTLYNFSATSSDGNLEDINYTFSWGDGTPETAVSYIPSGEPAETNHTYAVPGIYSVTVQAQDAQGLLSAWSQPLNVDVTNASALNLTVGGSSALYNLIENAAQSFTQYYNNLNPTNTLNPPLVYQGGSDSGAISGVANGAYDIGMLDRLPTQEEWNLSSNANIQLWAIAYNGTLPPAAQYTQTLNASDLVWLVTNYVPLGNVKEMFINYIQNDTALLNSYGLNATRAGDISGIPSNAAYQGQTQSFPDGIVDFNDIVSFINAYIQYYQYNSGICNPLADFNCSVKIDFNNIVDFINSYIEYAQNYMGSSGNNQGKHVINGQGNPAPTGVIRAVQSGTGNVSSWSLGPNPNPVNSTIAVDVRVDNASGVGTLTSTGQSAPCSSPKSSKAATSKQTTAQSSSGTARNCTATAP